MLHREVTVAEVLCQPLLPDRLIISIVSHFLVNIESFRQQPALTGLLLGLVIWLAGSSLSVGAGIVALLFFGIGVVLAVFGERPMRQAGQALVAAGVTALLLPVASDVATAILDELAPSHF